MQPFSGFSKCRLGVSFCLILLDRGREKDRRKPTIHTRTGAGEGRLSLWDSGWGGAFWKTNAYAPLSVVAKKEHCRDRLKADVEKYIGQITNQFARVSTARG